MRHLTYVSLILNISLRRQGISTNDIECNM